MHTSVVALAKMQNVEKSTRLKCEMFQYMTLTMVRDTKHFTSVVKDSQQRITTKYDICHQTVGPRASVKGNARRGANQHAVFCQSTLPER